MVPDILKGLAEEKIVLVKHSKAASITFPVKGIIRLVDEKGGTLGLVLDKQTLEDIQEDTEAQNPVFLASLDESRRSGMISGKKIKSKIK